MSTMNFVNQLPVNTWNHLKVNQGILELNIPKTILNFKEDSEKAHINSDFLPSKDEYEEMNLKFKEVFPENNVVTTLDHNISVDEMMNSKNYYFIGEKKRYEEPLTLSYQFNYNQPYLMKENYIYAKEGSQVTILLYYHSKDSTSATLGLQTYIYVEKNATVNLHIVQLLNDDSSHFEYLRGYTEEDANLNITQVELGAKQSYIGSEVIVANDNSSYVNDVIYLGTKTQTLDMNYIARIYGKNSITKIKGIGSLDEESEKVFRATIDFIKGCTNSSGEESEETLLLSSNVKNKSVPIILCGEDHVSGAHAATIGRLNENQLFYLMTKGLSLLESKQLLILSRFKEIYRNIPDSKIREEIENYIRRSVYYESNQPN